MIEIQKAASIEDPRGYGPGAQEQLRQLLELGCPAHRDSQRSDFYEIDGNKEAFYIYVSPVCGNVVLVARWTCETQESCVGAANIAA